MGKFYKTMQTETRFIVIEIDNTITITYKFSLKECANILINELQTNNYIEIKGDNQND